MSDPIVTFIYASQTGNCEEISMDLHTTARSKGYTSERYEFDQHLKSFDLTQTSQKRVVVIICSSTGDGECPDNGNKFFRYLCKHSKVAKQDGTASTKIFSHLYYTILGLGDSDYSALHKAPKMVDSCFENLGAKSFHYFAKADEAVGLELEVEPWINRLWDALSETVQSAKSGSSAPPKEETKKVITPKVEISESGDEEEDKQDSAKICSRSIESNKYRKVVKLELELNRTISETENIEPGSYISIKPKNDPKFVTDFIKALQWEETEELVTWLTNDVDFLKQVNKKSIISVLGDSEYLQENSVFNYLDYLQFLSSPYPYGEEIMEILPTMKSRFYSLSSDPVDTNKLEVCFAVEEHEQSNVFMKGNTTVKQGVCSNYLDRLSEESKTEFDVKLGVKSLFNTTSAELRGQPPLIFISHGTAVVPFIGVLRRLQRMLETKEIKALGDIDFYFGIRNKAHDYLYKKELEGLFEYFKSTNPEGKYNIHIAESRPDCFSERKYVQDLLVDDTPDLEYKVQVKKAIIYMCGNGNTMVKPTEMILEGLTGPKTTLKGLLTQGRYKKEVWVSN